MAGVARALLADGTALGGFADGAGGARPRTAATPPSPDVRNPSAMTTPKTLMATLRALALCVAALFAAGCERTIFGVVNRGVAPPSASVVFDPEHRLSLDVYRPTGGAAVAVVVFFTAARGNAARARSTRLSASAWPPTASSR
ncbi:MAG: hypothetical protein ACREO8_07705 [Luteimonas sp.]